MALSGYLWRRIGILAMLAILIADASRKNVYGGGKLCRHCNLCKLGAAESQPGSGPPTHIAQTVRGSSGCSSSPERV